MITKHQIKELCFRNEYLFEYCLRLLGYQGGTIHDVYSAVLKGKGIPNPRNKYRRVYLLLCELAEREFGGKG